MHIYLCSSQYIIVLGSSQYIIVQVKVSFVEFSSLLCPVPETAGVDSEIVVALLLEDGVSNKDPPSRTARQNNILAGGIRDAEAIAGLHGDKELTVIKMQKDPPSKKRNIFFYCQITGRVR